jgi:hypothetical protein
LAFIPHQGEFPVRTTTSKSPSADVASRSTHNPGHRAREAQHPDTTGDATSELTHEELFEQCKHLALAPSILDAFSAELRRCGVVGSMDNFQILFLAMVTRLWKAPVSVVIKGSATAGKSFTVDTVLRYTPEDAYAFFSGMSQKAIIYTKRDLRHKMLCIGEYAGLQSDTGNQWIRQLLTEGRIVYSVTGEDSGNGREAPDIVKEGPTGLIMTTTAMRLHPEDETRLISLPIKDSPEQTAAVLKAQAMKALGIADVEANTAPWIALHKWIATGTTQVAAPFLLDVADKADPTKGRMRRDFPKVIALVQAHALLHKATRPIDDAGRIVATLDDYEVVYDLLAQPLAEGQVEILEPGVNEVVTAVSVLSSRPEYQTGVPQTAIVTYLGDEQDLSRIDKSTVSRRVQKALEQGYLAAPPVKSGSGQRLRIGNPRGQAKPVLPHPDSVRQTTGA